MVILTLAVRRDSINQLRSWHEYLHFALCYVSQPWRHHLFYRQNVDCYLCLPFLLIQYIHFSDTTVFGWPHFEFALNDLQALNLIQLRFQCQLTMCYICLLLMPCCRIVSHHHRSFNQAHKTAFIKCRYQKNAFRILWINLGIM